MEQKKKKRAKTYPLRETCQVALGLPLLTLLLTLSLSLYLPPGFVSDFCRSTKRFAGLIRETQGLA